MTLKIRTVLTLTFNYKMIFRHRIFSWPFLWCFELLNPATIKLMTYLTDMQIKMSNLQDLDTMIVVKLQVMIWGKLISRSCLNQHVWQGVCTIEEAKPKMHSSVLEIWWVHEQYVLCEFCYNFKINYFLEWSDINLFRWFWWTLGQRNNSFSNQWLFLQISRGASRK